MAIPFANSALLIIDVQNDFCPARRNSDGSLSEAGSLAVPGGNEILPAVNRLSQLFDSRQYPIVATQDWHPPQHCSFASTPVPAGQERGLWPDHCVQGTVGAELHPDLNQKPIRLIIRKGFRPHLDSYSAFFENDHQTPTGLEGYLKSLAVNTLYLVGLATDYCVKYSALDGRRLGFTVYVVSDAVRGVNFPKGSLNHALEEMAQAGVQFMNSTSLD